MTRLTSFSAAALVAVALAGLAHVAPAAAQQRDPVTNFFSTLFTPREATTARPQPRRAAVKRTAQRRSPVHKSVALKSPAPQAAPVDIRQTLRDTLISDPALLRNSVTELLRNDPEIRRILTPPAPVVQATPVAPPAAPEAAHPPTPFESAADQTRIEQIVRNYLLTHPEVLTEAMNELEKRQSAAEQAKQKAAVATHSDAIFNSQRQVVIGNPQGDVTVVEFFDYNCGFCKKAMSDMLDLIKTDGKLRFVLKEFPVLGDGSIEAAHVATAVRMQDRTGKKYLDFHQRLLSGRGEANKARALAAAKEAGLDMARIDKDMASDEAKASLKESFTVAEALGLTGTPSYVVGNDIVIGAVGMDTLKAKISNARCGKATC